MYEPNGFRGWAHKGLKLLDWGRGIDMTVMPEDVKFRVPPAGKGCGDASVECWEIRNGGNFTYQVDWYGVAGVLHVLLFGKYMKVEEGAWSDDFEGGELGATSSEAPRRPPRIRLVSTFKRYWQFGTWKRLFDVLLNAGAYSDPATFGMADEALEIYGADQSGPEEFLQNEFTDYRGLDDRFPAAARIRKLRKEMEMWIVESCNRGKSLKSVLKKQEQLLNRAK